MATASADPAPDSATQTASTPTSTIRKLWGVVLAVSAGFGMSVQARINGQLGLELGDSALAAVISFGGGLLLLLCWLAVSRPMRAGTRAAVAALRSGRLRPWHFLGGIAGGTYVLGQSLTVSLIGVALFTVGVVAGQTVSGLFVDRFGLGPSGKEPTTVLRVAGAVMTVAAVAGAVAGDVAGQADPARIALLILPFVAGAGMAVQQAFNGHVGAASGSSLTAALVNFTTGTAMLVLASLVSLALHGAPAALPGNPVLYLGGLVGIVFIAVASFVVSWIGVLLLGLSTVAGQLLGSMLLDAFLPTEGNGLTTSTVVACGVALLAIGVASLGGRKRPGAGKHG
ncbi:DMT family transporter [Prauserella halophila]|uniref:DMT family transporter n=1 Tax=Prauserella halophila TaxID=185641 RepID=A0ABN1WFP0_9PSEU|nr:DMT family transporter [Prauserella halophila]MCP2238484.1 transporter family-2 protein [Prauserella halophila]